MSTAPVNPKRPASPERAGSQLGPSRPRNKRMRYTAHACTECQRRKIKCTGKEPCVNCVTSGATCQYSQSMQRGRPRRNKNPKLDNTPGGRATGSDVESSVARRLRLLENEIRSLRESQSRRDSSGHHAQDTPVDVPGMSPEPPMPDSSPDQSPHHPERGTSIVPPLDPRIFSSPELARNQASGASPGCISRQDDVANPNTFPSPCLRMEKAPLAGAADTELHPQTVGDPIVDGPDHIHCLLRFNTELENNMHLFFDEFEYWLPCMQMKEIWPRLLHIFQTSDPQQDGILVPLDAPANAPLLALVCTIMAISEFLKVPEYAADPLTDKPRTGGSRTHQTWHAESVKLMGCARHNNPSMDSLRQSLLTALYHLMLDRLHESSQAIARAVDMAYAMDLNNESCWVGFSEDDRFSRRMLWWTLYLFDRRVARKIGRPYYIQDRDTSVSDFSSSVSPRPESSVRARSSSHYSPGCGKSGENPTFDWCWVIYLQFHVEWSRICTKVWDDLYAMCAPNTGDESHIESLDAMVVRLRRNLPPVMIWETSALASESDTLAWSPTSRLQLVVFTRINLLRLWIRHSSITRCKGGLDSYLSEADLAHSIMICQNLACATINAVTAYMEARLYQRPFATYATVSLAECLHHLLSLPSPALDSEEVQKAFASARKCLGLMSDMGITSAHSPLKSGRETPSRGVSLPNFQLSPSTWFDLPLSQALQPSETGYRTTAICRPNDGFNPDSPVDTLALLDASQAIIW